MAHWCLMTEAYSLCSTKRLFHFLFRNAVLYMSSYRITKALLRLNSGVHKCMTGSSIPVGVWLSLGFKHSGRHSPGWNHSLDATEPVHTVAVDGVGQVPCLT